MDLAPKNPGDDTDGVADIRRAAAGDPAGIGALYDRYASLVMAVALRITGDSDAAEDVAQETFVHVWQNARHFDPAQASLKTWILAICRDRALDLAGSPSMPAVWQAAGPGLDRAAIERALMALPGPERQVIELACLRGQTEQEIVASTGTPVETVRSRVGLGLLRIGQHLKTPGPGEVAATPS